MCWGILYFSSADLLGLLKWKAQPEQIDRHLENLIKLDGQEIVKVQVFLNSWNVDFWKKRKRKFLFRGDW